MIGAIAGDMIGSPHEFRPIKTTRFELFTESNRFTDDTVMSVAVAEWLMSGQDLVSLFHDYFDRFPDSGFGGWFRTWASSRCRDPYNSFGNGSAMRVVPVGWACDTLDDVLERAKESAEVTHDHPEGIRGAQATAGAVFIGRTGGGLNEIYSFVTDRFHGYDLDRTVDQIRGGYQFDVTCQGSVPEAIICVLEAASFEEAVRNAVSLGGDSDTQACIAGGIAEAMWGVPQELQVEAIDRLAPSLLDVVKRFGEQFCLGG